MVMNPDADHYGVLGLSSSASAAEIKAAYKRCALEYHPDRNKHQSAKADFQRISEVSLHSPPLAPDTCFAGLVDTK